MCFPIKLNCLFEPMKDFAQQNFPKKKKKHNFIKSLDNIFENLIVAQFKSFTLLFKS